MNKTQFYTLSSALLASTALTAGASAGTVGVVSAAGAVTTTPVSVANTVFSTTASTANSVVIGPGDKRFGMAYSNQYAGSTAFSTEFTVSGARFNNPGSLTTTNVALMIGTTGNTTTVTASVTGAQACNNVTALGELLVVENCHATSAGAFTNVVAVGIALSGVSFTSASGLASVGGTVSLSGRVYNHNNVSQIFESTTTGTILSSKAPLAITVTAGTNQTADATSTPLAFSSLSNGTIGNLSMTLATVTVTGTGALLNDLTTTVAATDSSTVTLTVASSIFSSGAVRAVSVGGSSTNYLTSANFSGGSITFSSTAANFGTNDTLSIAVSFLGTTAIPAAVAGTVTGTISADANDKQTQAITGTTAAVEQGGFRAEVNTFNSSTNGPFGSYLRIHNNGNVAGTVTITVRNDATGEVLGSSYTTAAIAPNSTVQFSALQIETGANVPSASRTGSYTLSLTGPMIGYVQHILFDGNSVADLSGYRNSRSTANNP